MPDKSIVDNLSEALGNSDDQTPDEIREELRDDGVDIDTLEQRLLKYRDGLMGEFESNMKYAKSVGANVSKPQRQRGTVLERSKYDKQLLRWVRNHYWDSLEKDKDLILRHLRTFAGDEPAKNEKQKADIGTTSEKTRCIWWRECRLVNTSICKNRKCVDYTPGPQEIIK